MYAPVYIVFPLIDKLHEGINFFLFTAAMSAE